MENCEENKNKIGAKGLGGGVWRRDVSFDKKLWSALYRSKAELFKARLN